MFVTLRPRYALRNYREQDAASVAEHADNPNVARFLRSHFPNPYTLSDAVDWIGEVLTDDTKIILAITCDDQAIGSIGIHPGNDVYSHTAELGYWLSEDHWGIGLTTEAVRVVCGLAFRDKRIERLFAHVFEANRASSRILEKNGFVLEGRLRQHVEKDGETHDERVYGLLRTDWEAPTGAVAPRPTDHRAR